MFWFNSKQTCGLFAALCWIYFSGQWDCLEDGVGECKKDCILKPEGIDYVCLGMKRTRAYYLGVCVSEALGSQRDGYLYTFNV